MVVDILVPASGDDGRPLAAGRFGCGALLAVVLAGEVLAPRCRQACLVDGGAEAARRRRMSSQTWPSSTQYRSR